MLLKTSAIIAIYYKNNDFMKPIQIYHDFNYITVSSQ